MKYISHHNHNSWQSLCFLHNIVNIEMYKNENSNAGSLGSIAAGQVYLYGIAFF